MARYRFNGGRLRVGGQRVIDPDCCCFDEHCCDVIKICGEVVGSVANRTAILTVSGITNGIHCSICPNANGIFMESTGNFVDSTNPITFVRICNLNYNNNEPHTNTFDFCLPSNLDIGWWEFGFGCVTNGPNISISFGALLNKKGTVGAESTFAQYLLESALGDFSDLTDLCSGGTLQLPLFVDNSSTACNMPPFVALQLA